MITSFAVENENSHVESYIASPRSSKNVERILNNGDQRPLEAAVLFYQEQIQNGDQRMIDLAYEQVCMYYPPLNFIHVWYKKYAHLYDSREDFIQEYLLKFCDVLQNWKPRDERGESRYGGKGTFANYFIGALNNYYSNRIGRSVAAKRNMGIRCPICDVWCNPLSTHILESHPELLFEQVSMMGIDLSEHIHCPFCKSHKPPKRAVCEHTKARGRRKAAPGCDECYGAVALTALKKHLQDKHSSLLFERFRDLYPHHVTMSVRPISVTSEEDEEGAERDLYDTVIQDNKLENLLNSKLSKVQRQIIESIVIEKATALVYSPDVYNVSAEEFEQELSNLKNTMTLCGWKDSEDGE